MAHHGNRGPRENFRISGPGPLRMGMMERAQNTAADTLLWLVKGPMRFASYLVLAGVAMLGGGWTKGKLSNGFNDSAQPLAAVVPAPHIIPAAPDSSPPAPPAAAKPEPNLKDGPLWGKMPSPPPVQKESTFQSLKNSFPSFGKTEWTSKQLMAKVDSHTANDPLPADLLKKIIAFESGGDVYAKSKTNARGLGQFRPQTQLEYMYKCREFLPAPYGDLAAKHIMPNENGVGYRIKSETPHRIKKKIMDAVYNPDVSIVLLREHLRYRLTAVDQSFRTQLASEIRYLKSLHNTKTAHKERIAEMERHLSRPLTSADAEWAHMTGDGNASTLIAAYADPLKRKHKATDYISQTAARANKYMFNNLTVEQSRARVVEKVGDTPLPRDLSRPGETAVAKNVTPPSDFQPS